MCSEPTNVARARGEHLLPPARQLLVPAHRVLELRPVGLDRERDAHGCADRTPEKDMVGEDGVCGKERAHGLRVRFDPTIELAAGAVLEATHVVAVVAVEDEDRQQTAHVGTHGSGRAQVVRLGVRFLREHGDVVPRVAPFACQHPRVHVRAGASEEVAVPEEDAHTGILPDVSSRRTARGACDNPRPDVIVATVPLDARCGRPSRRRGYACNPVPGGTRSGGSTGRRAARRPDSRRAPGRLRAS